MDVPTPSNVNHGFSHNTDGFLNISIESPNLDPLSTKRRRCLLILHLHINNVLTNKTDFISIEQRI